MIKHNNDIRTKARENGVYLYEIAEKLNVSEPTFNRWLRKELSENLKQKALVHIELADNNHTLVIKAVDYGCVVCRYKVFKDF